MDVFAYGSALETLAQKHVPEGCFRMTVKQMLGMGITAVPGKPPVPWMGLPAHGLAQQTVWPCPFPPPWGRGAVPLPSQG